MSSIAYICVNPIPDHGGTFLFEKLNPSGIWKGASMKFTVHVALDMDNTPHA
jgi:hypothetical protein